MSWWENSRFKDREFMSMKQFREEATEEEKEEFYKEQLEKLVGFNKSLLKHNGIIQQRITDQILGQQKSMLENIRQSLRPFHSEEFLNSFNNADDLLKAVAESGAENERKIQEIKAWARRKGYTDEQIGKMAVVDILEQMEAEEEDIFPIEILKSTVPDKHIIPNNKLANRMTDGRIPFDGREFDLLLNKQNNISNPVTINYEDDAIQIQDKDKRFTPYDRSVYNAVCSLYEADNNHFTPDQVYRCMNGLTEKESVSPQAVGHVTRSIDKMRKIHAKVDYTNEMKTKNKENTDQFIIEGFIINADKIRIKAGGYEVAGYRMLPKPILYEYAQVTKQVISVPSKLLNTKDVIRNTEEVIVIREYLIRRIEIMKHPKNKNYSNRILFESVFNELDLPNPTSKKSMKVRNIIFKILDKYKAEKYIKNYAIHKASRSFKGVDIFY